jgi:type II secretory pathway pseudopilin PulG
MDKPVKKPSTEKLTKPQKKPKNSFYLLRYILSLIFGGIFIGTFIGLIFIITSHLFAEEAIFSSEGTGFAVLLSFFLVSGVTHLALATSLYKMPEVGRGTLIAKKIFQILFLVGLIGTSIGFAIALFYPLVTWIFGLDSLTAKEIFEPITFSFFSLVILGLVFVYYLNPKISPKKCLYPTILGALAVIALILFAIFPSSDLRAGLEDQKKIDDLQQIENAIDAYTDENYKLPTSLDQITIDEKLNFDLDSYTYTIGTTTSKRLNYTLCASDFKTNTYHGSGNPSSVYFHKSGTTCYNLYSYLPYSYED